MSPAVTDSDKERKGSTVSNISNISNASIGSKTNGLSPSTNGISTNGSVSPADRRPSSLTSMRAAVERYPIVLVTGGTGYIGSHTVLELLKAGCAVVVIDNLSNSHMESLIRVMWIAREEYRKAGFSADDVPPVFFHQADIRDKTSMLTIFDLYQGSPSSIRLYPVDIRTLVNKRRYKTQPYSFDTGNGWSKLPVTQDTQSFGKIVAVIHFAALKAVGESVLKPIEYYQTNVTGLLILLEVMRTYKIKNIVFSSSAVVYGTGKEENITEDAVQVGGHGPGAGLLTNPYGRSKWMCEEILNDYCCANLDFQAIALRYFNPTGSHPSGLIGEDPKGTPNNIVPVILQAYQRRRSRVHVFGANYDTADGTGVRDFIHVEDLARGHVAALRKLGPQEAVQTPDGRTVRIPSITISEYSDDSTNIDPMAPVPGAENKEEADTLEENYRVYNLGTGRGYSVLDILKAFGQVCGTEIPYDIGEARAGDLGTVTANNQKATTELGWTAEFDLQDMCRDVYNWAAENPQGYERLRRLSSLALQDPMAMRKASVDAGFNLKDQTLTDLISGMENIAQRKASFQGILRKMSNLSVGSSLEGIKEDEEEESKQPEPANWGMFGANPFNKKSISA